MMTLSSLNRTLANMGESARAHTQVCVDVQTRGKEICMASEGEQEGKGVQGGRNV